MDPVLRQIGQYVRKEVKCSPRPVPGLQNLGLYQAYRACQVGGSVVAKFLMARNSPA
jgi:hypothetical protein